MYKSAPTTKIGVEFLCGLWYYCRYVKTACRQAQYAISIGVVLSDIQV